MSTSATNGIEDFSVRIAPFATLPNRPPPSACPRSRTDSPRGATAPYWRSVPSSSRTAGPKRTNPATASRTKCRSCGPLAAKCSTGSHANQPSSDDVSRTGAPAPARIGARSRVNSCPGVPSDSPSSSLSTISAWIASIVPPTVDAARPLITGDALYCG